MSVLTRREILKLGGAATAAGLAFPVVLRAQPKEIPMLGLWSFTGAFSDVGPVLDRVRCQVLWCCDELSHGSLRGEGAVSRRFYNEVITLSS